jgi:murein DD-endopeptidase MepM/ murein hydrolase activator NlpD
MRLIGDPCPERLYISQGFSRAHPGVDMAAPEGAPVFAAHAGRVRIGYDNRVYGLYIVMDGFFDEEPLQTFYAHLGQVRVPDGAWVSEGQLIGNVGLTGRTSGPHLHFALRWCGALVDALEYIG